MISLDFYHETLLAVLTHDVRLLTHDQIARLLGSGRDEANRIVEELVHSELVAVETHLVSVLEQAAYEVIGHWSTTPSDPA